MPSAKRIRTRKRNRENSSPAQVIASVDDLLSEILVRLPIKSLLRFKSVSKQWLSLISDPHFIRRKCLKSKPVSLLALNEVHRQLRYELRYDVVPLQGKAPLRSLTFANPPDRMAIVSSCNGLLLCGTCLNVDHSGISYCIYNPTTRKFRIIPSPPGQSTRNVRVMGFCLAFEPSKSHRYIVACIQRLEPSRDLFQLEVYSSETEGWRDSGAPFSLPPHTNFHRAIYCHGAIHWIHNGASLCFDLDKELAREIPLPPPPRDSTAQAREVAYFGESGGHLHFVQVFNFSTEQFPIYEMESDCSCWFVKFAVDLSGAISTQYRFRSQLLHLARGEKEEDSFLVMHVDGKVFRYYFRNKTRQAIYSAVSGRNLIQCNFSDQTERFIRRTTSKIASFFSSPPHIHQYIESLSLV